jgi:hypothetical protein
MDIRDVSICLNRLRLLHVSHPRARTPPPGVPDYCLTPIFIVCTQTYYLLFSTHSHIHQLTLYRSHAKTALPLMGAMAIMVSKLPVHIINSLENSCSIISGVVKLQFPQIRDKIFEMIERVAVDSVMYSRPGSDRALPSTSLPEGMDLQCPQRRWMKLKYTNWDGCE